MAVNKVIYAGQTLLDLSGDSLTAAGQLLRGVTAHSKAGAVLTGTAKKVITQAASVPVSAFVTGNGITDYPYRAQISISGVTEDLVPYVSFSDEDAASTNYSQEAESYNGGVYIYAATKPTADVSIPKIECVEV